MGKMREKVNQNSPSKVHVHDINVMYCITLIFENPLRIIKNYTMGWGLKNFWTGIWEVCGGHLTLR